MAYKTYHSPEQTYIKQMYADINNPNITKLSPEFTSQIPGTKFSCVLDRDLLNLPRDLYVSKLLRLTHESDTDLSSYRDLLLRRARTIEGCPTGKIVTRRGSRKEPMNIKLANDCYVIDSFIKGERDVEFEGLFTKTKPQCDSDQNKANTDNTPKRNNSTEFQLELSKVLTNMIDLNKKYSELKEEQCKLSGKIKLLECENQRLTNENVMLIEKINLCNKQFHESVSNITDQVIAMNGRITDMNSVIAQRTECDRTTYEQITKTGENQSINLTRSEVERLPYSQQNNESTTDRKKECDERSENLALETDAKKKHIDPPSIRKHHSQNEVPTYADVVKNRQTKSVVDNLEPATDKLPLMIQDPVTKRWSRAENSVRNTQTDHIKSQTSKELPSHKHDTGNKIETVITNKRGTRQSEKTLKGNNKQLHQNGNKVTSWSEAAKVFKGQYTGRVKRYYIGGIHRESTEYGLEEYLTDRGVNPIELSLFESKRGNICAKVTIPYYEDYLIEDIHFWPRFMRCSQWMSKNDWNHRRNYSYEHTSNYVENCDNVDIE
jgi:hypothetical protein